MTKTREEELKKEIESYKKSGKEDIEIYFDDDFGNIQRFKGRISFWKKQAELKGIEEGRRQALEDVEKIVKKTFKAGSIYTGRIVLYELKSKIGDLKC